MEGWGGFSPFYHPAHFQEENVANEALREAMARRMAPGPVSPAGTPAMAGAGGPGRGGMMPSNIGEALTLLKDFIGSLIQLFPDPKVTPVLERIVSELEGIPTKGAEGREGTPPRPTGRKGTARAKGEEYMNPQEIHSALGG